MPGLRNGVNMVKLLSSVACNLDSNILLATLPLFQDEKVQAIEWSFDALYKFPEIPAWFEELLQIFSQENRLIGHGVFFSLFSGKWTKDQAIWLDRLREYALKYNFDHITEHFGFMTGANFHQGAPISVPLNSSTLQLGIDRLKRIQDAAQCPVGLENLALAYSAETVKQHGDFLRQLIEPVNGFIILDLHNLYCQLHNFDISFDTLIQLYPLNCVREIHISGGSWEASDTRPEMKIRRDTHDDAVPEAVFHLLEQTLPLCPNLKYIVLEQLGTGLNTPIEKEQFQKDFLRMDQIVQAHQFETKQPNTFLPHNTFQLDSPYEDLVLYEQQIELSTILENSDSPAQAQTLLEQSSLANTNWNIENWEMHMLETVVNIAQKWKDGF